MNIVEKAISFEEAVQSVVRGHRGVIRRVLATMVAGGHVLLEDFPGTGKTTLAKAIAKTVDGVDFKRIQFTPDLLPSDILGVSILEPRSQEIRFHRGPVFTDVLLADEINRASPRTQSALLEAMGERQATVEGVKHDLGELFLVIATQNPIEFRGTYPLPEAQMDRFMIQCSMGYVTIEDEVSILIDHSKSQPLDRLRPVITREDLSNLRAASKSVRFSDELRHYVVQIVASTRGHPSIQLPASPRASLALMQLSQAMALFEGDEFVTPEHIQSVAADVIAHRLSLTPEARYGGINARHVVAQLLESQPVPA